MAVSIYILFSASIVSKRIRLNLSRQLLNKDAQNDIYLYAKFKAIFAKSSVPFMITLDHVKQGKHLAGFTIIFFFPRPYVCLSKTIYVAP